MAVTNPPPREDLVRALPSGFELRDQDAGPPTMVGHFARFDEWAEISSYFEGNFMERIAAGAFKKTFQERTPKVLFQHGQDPQLGDKPLGRAEVLQEDRAGAYYEVPLFRGLPDLVVDGLRAGAYGSSFRFKVMREEFVDEPGVSAYNPKGLPERTLKEVQVAEFGPVTFPAYEGATAGMRSLTDRYRGRLEQRLDAEDLSLVAQMIALGAEYVDEQDEPGEPVSKMEAVLVTLAELAQYETGEDEGNEPEDEAASSAGRDGGRGAPPDGAGLEAHPIRGRRATHDNALYGADQEEEEPWRLP